MDTSKLGTYWVKQGMQDKFKTKENNLCISNKINSKAEYFFAGQTWKETGLQVLKQQ